mmetsp:Transcript_5041/g.6516  ORF Transcript_5041/g.6516 Transcript_5041/m.6516 type:complete len:243 (-) Transcript_5041:118-846(-)
MTRIATLLTYIIPLISFNVALALSLSSLLVTNHHCNNAFSDRKTFMKSITVALATTTIATTTLPSFAYDPDPDQLRESLYFMSRVQEATVQQERLINRNLTQQELYQKLKLSLRLVDKSYRLLDQINYCSKFVNPQSEVVEATEAGLEAVEALQSAIDFVNNDLKPTTGSKGDTGLKNDQRDFLLDALRTTREKLFVYVSYMPQEKLQEARLRIERENVDNRDEFDGPSDAGVYNPVKLPWK